MNKQSLKWVIFGGLFFVPFIPFFVSSSFFFPFIVTKAFAFRIVVEIIFAAWVILALMEPEYRPKKSVILYSLLGFLAIIGLANLFGEAPVKSFWSNFERMEGYVTLLHLGAFFLVASSALREIDWRRWWNTSLAASALMFVYVLFQLAGSITINQGGARVDGTFGNASYLAVYALFHSFVAILFYLRDRRHKTAKWLYATAAFMNLFVVYHTATRGAILGVLGGLVVFAILNIINKEDAKLRKTSLAVLGLVVLIVGGVWFARDTSLVQGSPVLARFADISSTELQGGGRSFVWPMAIEGIKERPLLGWGQENFNYVFQEHYVPEMSHLEPWFDRAHNIFLDWGVAGGLLGLLSYLSLYVALLYVVWKSADLSHAERAAITALVAAYFFHNLFVFDHLISYVLFFSLLAYMQSMVTGVILWTREVGSTHIRNIAVPGVILFALFSLYFINIRPMAANASVIEALKAKQLNQSREVIEHLKSSYSKTRLGRQEIVDQMSSNAVAILQSGLPIAERNEFFDFVKDAVQSNTSTYENDARVQLIAGSFHMRTGQFDQAEEYLLRAQDLIPGKLAVYMELGALYLNQDNHERALAEFKRAYDMAPNNEDAKVIYLVGAIYANERALENELINELSEQKYIFDSRILSAYRNSGRIADAVEILERRIVEDPENAATYREAIEKL